MEHESAGFLLTAGQAKIFAAVWTAMVLVYGLWRSSGDAAQDTIRDAGPGVG